MSIRKSESERFRLGYCCILQASRVSFMCCRDGIIKHWRSFLFVAGQTLWDTSILSTDRACQLTTCNKLCLHFLIYFFIFKDNKDMISSNTFIKWNKRKTVIINKSTSNMKPKAEYSKNSIKSFSLHLFLFGCFPPIRLQTAEINEQNLV